MKAAILKYLLKKENKWERPLGFLKMTCAGFKQLDKEHFLGLTLFSQDDIEASVLHEKPISTRLSEYFNDLSGIALEDSFAEELFLVTQFSFCWLEYAKVPCDYEVVLQYKLRKENIDYVVLCKVYDPLKELRARRCDFCYNWYKSLGSLGGSVVRSILGPKLKFYVDSYSICKGCAKPIEDEIRIVIGNEKH